MKRILLVDDENDITYTIQEVLGNDYQIDTANDPIKALEEFGPEKYDLLIVDIAMPKMNGFDFCRQVRKRDKNIKVIIITALELISNEYYSNFRKEFADFQDFQLMKKPFGVYDLKERIEQLATLQ